MEKLSIGKMARLNQVSVQTLRLYDEMEILRPVEVNEETGYRYYDVRQSARLDMIHYMKSTGMTLKEIREVFKRGDLRLLDQVLHQHLGDIDKEIEKLCQKKKAVKRMMDCYDRYLKSPGDGMITLEYIEERKIYACHTDVNFYEYGIESYENILKVLKKEMIRQGIPEYYYYNAGTTIARENFLKENYVSDKIFVFIDQECKKDCFKTIPVSMFACIYCDDFDKETEYIQRLAGYIREHDMQVAGDYICEVLAELPVLSSDKRGMFLRLQVPVAFGEHRFKQQCGFTNGAG